VRWLVVVVAVVAGCGGDLDPPWQLDHDRIIAIRATPPALASGETSRIDALLAEVGSPTVERPPDIATVVSPQILAGSLTHEGADWVVTAPGEDSLLAARQELGLPDDAPVPLQIGVSYNRMTLVGLKTITLGMPGANPELPAVTIDELPAPASDVEIVVGKLVDVPLAIEATDTDDVNWLTSCGTMHDDDLPSARIRVEEDDPTEGQLAVVLRDDHGGVTWQVWSIRAE